MATIANLAKQKDGSITGTLLIPSFNGAKIVLTPVEKKGKGPEFRATIGAFEAGAAWKRETETATYYSVKLDDPTFARPIYCALFKTSGRLRPGLGSSQGQEERLRNNGGEEF
jgi:uncharacterized protein (DUF736 family)